MLLLIYEVTGDPTNRTEDHTVLSLLMLMAIGMIEVDHLMRTVKNEVVKQGRHQKSDHQYHKSSIQTTAL